MKFNKYHKIRQFKDIVRDVIHNSNFAGLDENDDAIYIEQTKPIIHFKGAVKIHGTNAGISYTPDEGIRVFKRNSMMGSDELQGHFGFNQFVLATYKDEFTTIMSELWNKYCEENEQLNMYGEWAGKGIQKGVAISEIDKGFYVFGLKVNNHIEETGKWIDIEDLRFDTIPNMYNINEFPTFDIDIDFNKPKISQNELIEITEAVEKECPVGKQLGATGVGEGVVWTGWLENGTKLIFKVKGEKHSTSKVKTLANVDPELLESIDAFVAYAATVNRFEQGIMETDAKVIQDIPNFLRWVANDIISEEAEEMKANNLEWKQVSRECSTKARIYYINKMNEL